MQGKPILSIKDFAGSGQGGFWFNNGLAVHSEGGQSMLIEDFKQESICSTSTTGFAGVSYIRAIQYLTTLNGVAGSNEYMLLLDADGNFYVKGKTATITDGKILETYANLGDYPDMKLLPSGNILVTPSKSSGVAYTSLLVRGTAMTGSSTTKIVDSAGRNFTTLGIATGEVVTNITTGQTYEITSITTTNSEDDTLNFDAGTAVTAGDEFITIDVLVSNLESGLTIPNFKGQPATSLWRYQIEQFDDYWFILNGNYIAVLDSDETTFDNAFKQLPVGHHALSIAINGSRVMLTTKTAIGDGYVLYWDGYSDGWLNIKKINGVANSVKAYKDGFIYLSEGRLYYSDGWNETLLSVYCDANDMASTRGNLTAYSFNSMVVSNDMVFIASEQRNYNRVLPGTYYWNKDYGWGFMPIMVDGRQSWGISKLENQYNDEIFPQVIYKNDNYDRIDIGHLKGLSAITDGGEYLTAYLSKSFMVAVTLPEDIQVKGIGLNVGINPKMYSTTGGDAQCSISVNVGDGRKGYQKYFSGLTIQSVSEIKNGGGGTNPGVLGKEVLVTGTYAGNTGTVECIGERTYVSSIANAGTANEVWTVSPVLSAYSNVAACTALQIMVDNAGTKTISIDDINEEQIFLTQKPFLGNKLIIEVVIHGIANAFPVAIQGVNIYA